MSQFDQLLEDISAQKQRRTFAPAPVSYSAPRPAASESGWGRIPSMHPDRQFAKAIRASLRDLQAETNQTAREIAATAGPARLADVRARGRALVAKTKSDLLKAVGAGEITAAQVVRAELYLNGFCVKMGI